MCIVCKYYITFSFRKLSQGEVPWDHPSRRVMWFAN